MKCTADVNMLPRGRMGSKCEIFRFFKSGYAHDRSIAIFRRRAFLRTGNTLSKPNYAGVRQSRDLLDRDRHKHTMWQKKSRQRRALKPLELRNCKKRKPVRSEKQQMTTSTTEITKVGPWLGLSAPADQCRSSGSCRPSFHRQHPRHDHPLLPVIQ